MKHVRSVGILSGVLALLFAVGCTKKQAPDAASTQAPTGDVLVIGQVGSMTGNEATFGVSTDRGIQLAVEELNAMGGVQGKKFSLTTLDNQGKSEESATAVTRLMP